MTPPNAVIAIGSYGQPSCVDLQARVIRATVGDVPIIVSDDHSETAHPPGDPDRGRRIKEHLMEVVVKHGLEFRHSGTGRIGHAGGDLGAYWHGLQFARNRGAEFLWKLSQRFIIDIPGWLQTGIRQTNKARANTACAPCYYGHGPDNVTSGPRFHFRTECIGFRVGPWCRPDILAALAPRRLNYAAEAVIETQFTRINNGSHFVQPSWLTQFRTERTPGICWKDNRPEDLMNADYAEAFKKYGVPTGEDFNTNHSCAQPGFLWG